MYIKILLVLCCSVGIVDALDSSSVTGVAEWDEGTIAWFNKRLVGRDYGSREGLAVQYDIYEEHIGGKKRYPYPWDLGLDLKVSHCAVEEMLKMSITEGFRVKLLAEKKVIEAKMKKVSKRLGEGGSSSNSKKIDLE